MNRITKTIHFHNGKLFAEMDGRRIKLYDCMASVDIQEHSVVAPVTPYDGRAYLNACRKKYDQKCIRLCVHDRCAGDVERELFASDNDKMTDNLQSALWKINDRGPRKMMHQVFLGMKPYEKGSYILTDDKAPVELLGMRMIDEMIRDEVVVYKDIYNRKGIQGLIDSLS